MKIIKTAKTAGFCYGVRRAVETTKKIKSDNPDRNVFVLGELIHNSNVISELENLGIKTVEVLPKDNDGICIIRSHGASVETFKKCNDRGFDVMDLTCPDVKKVQQKAIELAKNNYLVIIVGKSEHPEVIAIKDNAMQYSTNVFVISDKSEISSIEEKIKEHKKIGIVVQTTQTIDNLNEIITEITPIAKEFVIYNTICASTTLRQNEARELAKDSDLMIVVGSKKSANTTHLSEISKKITNTIHIENSDELDLYKDLINKANKIGVTAGASTPDVIINNVIDELKKY